MTVSYTHLAVDGAITALVVDDRSSGDAPTIILGTGDGRVLAYDLTGNPLWEHDFPGLEGGVRHLIVQDQPGDQADRLLVGGQWALYSLMRVSTGVIGTPLAAFDQPIEALYGVGQATDQETAVGLVVFLQDGAVRGLSHSGLEISQRAWPLQLEGRPIITDASEGAIEAFQENVSAFLVATDNGYLEQLTVNDNQPVISWRLDGLTPIQAADWADLDKDGRPDTGLVGTRDGNLWLYEQLYTRTPQRILEIPLASGLFHLALLERASDQSPDLLAVTQNGLVRLFREEENRPPLLTQPRIESESGQYTIGVLVLSLIHI